jgi:hypothetical protein
MLYWKSTAVQIKILRLLFRLRGEPRERRSLDAHRDLAAGFRLFGGGL